MQEQVVEKVKSVHAAYGRYLPAVAFLAGLTFDSLALGRIDSWTTLTRQAIYLGVSALLILGEYVWAERGPTWNWLGKIWPHQDEVNHFLLGSLLSSYTVFYFKSASIWPSLIFFFIIVVCLVGNEFKVVKTMGRRIRGALWILCLVSYAIYLVPIFWGEIGVWPFVVSLVAATLVAVIFGDIVRRMTGERQVVFREIGLAAGVIVGLFAGLYALKAVPPVPLSITTMGIYRSVERVPEGYLVTHHRPKWKFWHNGDQMFYAKPGDRVYCFFSVFSPGGFRDKLQVRWFYEDQNGDWQKSDAIPVAVSGGREEGYRGFTYKQNYQPGDWSVRVETSDGREVGRISLTIAEAEEALPPPQTQVL